MALGATLSELSFKTVLEGVGAGVITLGPVTALAIFLNNRSDEGSNPVVAILLLVTFAIFLALGAFTYARTHARSEAMPYTHAALVGLVTVGVVQLLVVFGNVISGGTSSVTAMALMWNALVASLLGMIGATVWGLLLGRRGTNGAK